MPKCHQRTFENEGVKSVVGLYQWIQRLGIVISQRTKYNVYSDV